MIICNSHRFVFVHIHKTGGTSIERALDPHLAWNDLCLGSTPVGIAINEAYKQRFGLNKHSSAADIHEVCGPGLFDSHYVFALVRRPVERICSPYNFAAGVARRRANELGLELADLAAKAVQDPSALPSVPGLGFPATQAFLGTDGFSDFIRSDLVRQDRGFLPQIGRLTVDGVRRVDAYRLEDLPAWLPTLRDRLGVDFDMPHLNRASEMLVSPGGIGAEDRGYLEQLYAADYAAFSY